MPNKKVLIICQSIHHGNTRKIAEVIAEELNADIKKPSETKPGDIDRYDVIGFGSGIYDDKHHNLIFDLVDRLPTQKNRKAFVFSTSGVPIRILGRKFFERYTKRCHDTIKAKLVSKRFKPIGEFSCPGFNTNVFLKYLGGINRNRPNAQDLMDAKEFAVKIKGSI